MKLQLTKSIGIFICALCALGADDVQFDTKVPLGLAHDGTVLWIADAAKRELSGYDVAQKKKLASRVLSFDVRDLAFWQPNLVTVAPNFVYVINPINGGLVDKIQLKSIADPVAIALDAHQAYIYNRADKKIYRVHLVDRMQYGSFTPEVTADIRSMTFYKGFLWAVAKDGKAYKLSPTDGQQVSFLPLPEECYGIAFVDGGMYVARPGQVRTIDFIETDNYVAAAKRSFTLAAALEISLPWSEQQRTREAKLKLKYSLLPVSPHQRIAGLRGQPAIRFGRQEDGAFFSEIALEQKSAETKRSYQLQLQATLFNLTYIFSGNQMKLYFKNPELPESVRPYLDKQKLSPDQQKAIEEFRESWLRRNEGKHPIFLAASVEKHNAFTAAMRIAAYRALGVPARRMQFFDLDKKQLREYRQIYIQPAGWVTITQGFDANKPKEFPVSNAELELFSPDDIVFSPNPKGAAVDGDVLHLGSVRILTSSIE